MWIQHTNCKSLLYDQKHENETQDFSRVSEQSWQEKKKEVIIIHKYYLIKSHLIYKREYI